MINRQDQMSDIADRRRTSRFTLPLAVKFRCVGSDFNRIIPGEVVNISSKGLLFRADEEVPHSDRKITAFIEWPAHLNNRVSLQLVVEGHVVRKAGDCTAIFIEKYEFRTRAMGVALAPTATVAAQAR